MKGAWVVGMTFLNLCLAEPPVSQGQGDYISNGNNDFKEYGAPQQIQQFPQQNQPQNQQQNQQQIQQTQSQQDQEQYQQQNPSKQNQQQPYQQQQNYQQNQAQTQSQQNQPQQNQLQQNQPQQYQQQQNQPQQYQQQQNEQQNQPQQFKQQDQRQNQPQNQPQQNQQSQNSQPKYGPPGYTAGEPLGLSQSQQSCRPNDPQANKALIKRMYQELFGDHNVDNIESYFHQDLIQHNPTVPDGIESLRKAVLGPLGQGPKMQIDVQRISAEEDLVWLHTRFPLVGEVLSTVDIFRFECGKIKEHWDVMQETNIMDKPANSHPFF